MNSTAIHETSHEVLHKAKETTTQGNNLELSLGISLNKEYKDVAVSKTTNICETSLIIKAAITGPRPTTRLMATTLNNGFASSVGGGGANKWFAAAHEPSSCNIGFIHPWSLAARQQKAMFEQAHHHLHRRHHHHHQMLKPSSSPSSSPPDPRFTPPSPPLVVGWPPVSASRRNMTGPSPTKPEMDGEKDAKKAKMTEIEEIKNILPDQVKLTMFVKVNMEGYAIGRKINLKAHDGYESLSHALQKLFNNFLLSNLFSSNSPQEEQDDENSNSDFLLLYEDHEGDRMLVGDVPWELFLTSVKRLYIALNKTPKSDDDNAINEQN